MQIKSSEKNCLLHLLEKLSPDSSKNTLRSWIDKGRVLIDGKPASESQMQVDKGQRVQVTSKPKFLSRGLKIFYEDEALVVVEKPAGLLSVATEKEQGTTAHAILKRRFNNRRVYPIHRLDRETSGLMVFAYTPRARDHLKKQLELRSMSREYEALVHGHPGEGTWQCFLKENRQMVVFVCGPSQGKEAITHFETKKKGKQRSLLRLKLQSGRKHQIRVQAADAGFPIVGDKKYGSGREEKTPLQLRAVQLKFSHPTSGRALDFQVAGLRSMGQ